MNRENSAAADARGVRRLILLNTAVLALAVAASAGTGLLGGPQPADAQAVPAGYADLDLARPEGARTPPGPVRTEVQQVPGRAAAIGS